MADENENARRLLLKQALPGLLPRYLAEQRWFGGKARTIRSVELEDAIPAGDACAAAYIMLVRIRFADGDSDLYALPLARISQERRAHLLREGRENVMIGVRGANRADDEVWGDALWDVYWPRMLLDAIAEGRVFRGSASEIQGVPTRALSRLRGDPKRDLNASVMSAEQSNTSVRYDDRLILKLFRRLQTGINPDVEICTFLTERTSFTRFAAVGGSLLLRTGDGETSLAILQAFVPNQGDAWTYTLRSLEGYFERLGAPPHRPVPPAAPLFPLRVEEPPPEVVEMMGGYLASARVLGERTAQLHLALASTADDPAFAPEPFSVSYQRGLCESMLDLAAGVFALLRSRLDQLGPGVRERAAEVVKREREVGERFHSALARTIAAGRIRIHGDYHLGQVLNTGDDFVIIDFEGEPARPISDRRIKQSPLRDVAGMLRSFHYAAFTALLHQIHGADGGRNGSIADTWARHWQSWASATFLKAYLAAARGAPFLPQPQVELESLLRALLLEKAVYELGYELNNRPDWVKIPLEGIEEVLNDRGPA